MYYNEQEVLIIQYNYNKSCWEDITARVQYYQDKNHAYRVKYKGNDTYYWKSYSDLKIFTKSRSIDITNKVVYLDQIAIYNLSSILDFGVCVKVFFQNGNTKIAKKDSLKILADITGNANVKNVLDYLKEISLLLPIENDVDFLFKQLDNLRVLQGSVLGKFLQGDLGRKKYQSALLFPFNANLSQRIAIQKAMEEDLSIIQGPPGTGKTETIRNIIANYVGAGKTVAVVSGNNEATKNVKDKFDNMGFGYINAFLGSHKNIEAFFGDMPSFPKFNNKEKPNDNILHLQEISKDIKKYLQYDFDIAKLSQTIEEYKTEKQKSDAEYNARQHFVCKSLLNKKYKSKSLLELLSLLEASTEKQIKNFFTRTKLCFKFGILNINELITRKNDSTEYLRNKYYDVKIFELMKEYKEKERYINSINLQGLIREEKSFLTVVFIRN